MKLIFELGTEGRGLSLMPACDVPEYTLPEERTAPLRLPHVSENELTRHYTALCKRIHGVNDGFYPLGSCTMKYNPKIDEDMAALPGFTQLHPLQPIETAQGALEALHTLGSELGEVFGMDTVTFQPAAGAHGEFTGVLLIKAYVGILYDYYSCACAEHLRNLKSSELAAAEAYYVPLHKILQLKVREGAGQFG